MGRPIFESLEKEYFDEEKDGQDYRLHRQARNANIGSSYYFWPSGIVDYVQGTLSLPRHKAMSDHESRKRLMALGAELVRHIVFRTTGYFAHQVATMTSQFRLMQLGWKHVSKL